MAPTPENVVVGANGNLRFAALGSPIPETIADPFSDAWTEFGFLNEDGVKTKDGKTIESIMAWQSFYPIRKIVTEREFSIAFTLQQFERASVNLALGGGTVIEQAANAFRYQPPDPEDLDERMAAVDWFDGDKHYRLVLPRGMNEEGVEFDVVRTTNVGLPITFQVIGQDIDADDPSTWPWALFTNDAAMAPEEGS